ncbi:SDR family NAD(P)-dependent oxidoreductase [Nocardia flavorosea]|uniref:SDR family oxidoreductase n=1 Tax=Nocardia flavorosea TaxID=53429 RepID=A0A846Y9N8_9NOCA|nr:SDR family oxidoreductase [Nocardia flavorosea]NKY55195.1 SDR family oxidoreductase [Nocardia flavorosea]
MARYTDKIALVTGGTSGMGIATAKRLIGEGAQVVVTGRDAARLEAAVADLGDRAHGFVADLTALDALMQDIRDRYDVVVANAGVGIFAPIREITEKDFDRSVAINFRGVFFTIQKALSLIPDGGAILVNASWTLHRGVDGLRLYPATKAAVHNLARTLATELAPRGIRVNSVSPGYIDTPMYPEAELPAQVAAADRSRVPAGRSGRPGEVADTVAFLASSEASCINGQDLIIDGGLVGTMTA